VDGDKNSGGPSENRDFWGGKKTWAACPKKGGPAALHSASARELREAPHPDDARRATTMMMVVVLGGGAVHADTVVESGRRVNVPGRNVRTPDVCSSPGLRHLLSGGRDQWGLAPGALGSKLPAVSWRSRARNAGRRHRAPLFFCSIFTGYEELFHAVQGSGSCRWRIRARCLRW
jgi:hypothetical protein